MAGSLTLQMFAVAAVMTLPPGKLFQCGLRYSSMQPFPLDIQLDIQKYK